MMPTAGSTHETSHKKSENQTAATLLNNATDKLSSENRDKNVTVTGSNIDHSRNTEKDSQKTLIYAKESSIV